MKKLLSLLLALILLFVCASSYAEDDEIVFTPNLAVSLDATAAESFKTSESRALLTCALIIDLLIETSDSYGNIVLSEDINLADASYVGKSGINLIVFLQGNSHDYVFAFQPLNELANCILFDHLTSTMREYVLEELCTDGYFENDAEYLYEFFLEISEAIE